MWFWHSASVPVPVCVFVCVRLDVTDEWRRAAHICVRVNTVNCALWTIASSTFLWFLRREQFPEPDYFIMHHLDDIGNGKRHRRQQQWRWWRRWRRQQHYHARKMCEMTVAATQDPKTNKNVNKIWTKKNPASPFIRCPDVCTATTAWINYVKINKIPGTTKQNLLCDDSIAAISAAHSE